MRELLCAPGRCVLCIISLVSTRCPAQGPIACRSLHGVDGRELDLRSGTKGFQSRNAFILLPESVMLQGFATAASLSAHRAQAHSLSSSGTPRRAFGGSAEEVEPAVLRVGWLDDVCRSLRLATAQKDEQLVRVRVAPWFDRSHLSCNADSIPPFPMEPVTSMRPVTSR